MTETDYIRRAVELADDIWPWDFYKFNLDSIDDKQQFTQRDKDALAAQLVRQVDALADNRSQGFYSRPLQADVYWPGLGIKKCGYSITCGDDRTMNTIKAIVDSGVLDTGESSE